MRSADSLRDDLRVLLRHAGTVLVGQLAVMAFGITDTVVAGRFAPEALAVLSIGSAIYISVYVSLNGVLQSLLPVYAELHGGKRYAQLGQTFRQSLYLCVMLMVCGMAIMLWPGALLRWAKVPEDLQISITQYLAILAWALIPSLAFRMYSSLNQGLGKPLLVTWLQIGSLCIKVPLTVWLTFGGAGVPAMGLAGCAWATFVVQWLILACGVLMLRTQSLYRPLKLWQRMEPPKWPQIGQFVRMGLPGGLAYLVEITSFTLMALFIARLGVISAASHQIAATMTGTMYMVPLSLSIACSARVSYWLGAGNAPRARRVACLGLATAAVLSSVMALLLWLLAQPVASLYSTSRSVVALGASLLGWVALYHVADAAQTICAFVLRSYRVTLLPLLIYGVMLWGVGLLGGYWLAYEGVGDLGSVNSVSAMQNPQAFWIAGAVALVVVAITFIVILAYSIKTFKPSIALPRQPVQQAG